MSRLDWISTSLTEEPIVALDADGNENKQLQNKLETQLKPITWLHLHFSSVVQTVVTEIQHSMLIIFMLAVIFVTDQCELGLFSFVLTGCFSLSHVSFSSHEVN